MFHAGQGGESAETVQRLVVVSVWACCVCVCLGVCICQQGGGVCVSAGGVIDFPALGKKLFLSLLVCVLMFLYLFPEGRGTNVARVGGVCSDTPGFLLDPASVY